MTQQQHINPDEQPKPAQPRKLKRKRWPGLLARFSGTLLLIALSMSISAALAMAWLTSDDGRAFIVAEAEKLVSTDTLTLELGPITRMGTRHLDIAQIRISDQDGMAVEIRDLSVTFSLAAMLTGNIHLNELNAAAISFDHTPDFAAGKDATPTPAEPFVMPVLSIDRFALKNIHITAAGADGFNAAGSLRLSPVLSKTALAVNITSAADNSAIAHLRAAPTHDDGAVEISAHVADDGTGLLARLTGLKQINIDITGSGPATGWQGTANINLGDAFQADGDLGVTLSDSAATLVLTGQTTSGGVSTKGKHSLAWRSQTGRTTLAFTGHATQGGITLPGLAVEGNITPRPTGGMDAQLTALARKVAPLLDSEVALAINARLRGHIVTVENSYLSARHEKLTFKGRVDTAKKTLSFDLASQIAALGKLDARFGGAAKAAMAITGDYKNGLHLSTQASINAQNLQTPWAQATAMLGAAPSLEIRAAIDDENGKVEYIRLSGANGKTVQLSGRFSGGSGAFDISGGLADYTVAGGLLLKPGHAEAEISQLTGPFGSAKAMLAYDQPSEAANGTVTWRSSLENTLTINFNRIQEAIEFNGNASGVSVRDYSVDFRGNGTLGADETTASLTSLNGTFGVNKLTLAKAAVLHIGNDGAHLDPAVLMLNDGRIDMSGRFGKQDFTASMKADALPANLDIFPLLFDGTINGDINLSGPYTNPAGTATLLLKNISLPGPKEDNGAPRYVEGNVQVTLDNGRADFTTRLSGTAGLRFNADGYLPVSFAPVGIPADKTLEAALDASVDLRVLTLLLGLDEHRMGGTATLDLKLTGTLDAPQVKGTGGLEKGRYDNLVTGTALRNIITRISADNGHLKLEELTGSDKNGGTFNGNGEIRFKTLREPEYTLDLTAKHLNLVSLDNLGLTVSGDLHSQGNAEAAAVTGKVIINNGEYYVTRSIGGDALSDFDVVETGEGLSQQTAEAPPPANGPDVSLDIALNAEHGIYVRGPDLESEWRADLHLGGSVREPALQGAISLIRGQYRLLDTTVLMKKGNITFTPPNMKDPDLDLSGELKGHGETAIINVTGSAAQPGVELTSETGLKDDELLAQVLFGKSLSELTPVQALRIARLMAMLSGHGGGGFDPLAMIRRAMGIDALSISMDEEGGATLSVGKYVSDKIYISIDQGATPESSAVRAEIEVTDEIEVETSSSGSNENTVGVNWKHDY